jgi:hypothetical protein
LTTGQIKNNGSCLRAIVRKAGGARAVEVH